MELVVQNVLAVHRHVEVDVLVVAQLDVVAVVMDVLVAVVRTVQVVVDLVVLVYVQEAVEVAVLDVEAAQVVLAVVHHVKVDAVLVVQ